MRFSFLLLPLLFLGLVIVSCDSGTKEETEDTTSTIGQQSGYLDLSTMIGDLPLSADSTEVFLVQTEDWEHSSWQNDNWPAGGRDSLGFLSVVKNIHREFKR